MAFDIEFTFENIDDSLIPKSSPSSAAPDGQDVPSTPNSPFPSEGFNGQEKTEENAIIIPAFLFNDVVNALKVCGKLTNSHDLETITTTIYMAPRRLRLRI